MKIHIIATVTGFLLYALSSCTGKESKGQNKASFRLLPADHVIASGNHNSVLLRLYAVDTYKDTADKDLITKIDSFMCTVKGSIKLGAHLDLIVRFLKETKLTKELDSTGVTDSNNPYSSEHFRFVDYDWDADGHFTEWINNAKYATEDTALNCK